MAIFVKCCVSQFKRLLKLFAELLRRKFGFAVCGNGKEFSHFNRLGLDFRFSRNRNTARIHTVKTGVNDYGRWWDIWNVFHNFLVPFVTLKFGSSQDKIETFPGKMDVSGFFFINRRTSQKVKTFVLCTFLVIITIRRTAPSISDASAQNWPQQRNEHFIVWYDGHFWWKIYIGKSIRFSACDYRNQTNIFITFCQTHAFNRLPNAPQSLSIAYSKYIYANAAKINAWFDNIIAHIGIRILLTFDCALVDLATSAPCVSDWVCSTRSSFQYIRDCKYPAFHHYYVRFELEIASKISDMCHLSRFITTKIHLIHNILPCSPQKLFMLLLLTTNSDTFNT